jgi:hypothetical protein
LPSQTLSSQASLLPSLHPPSLSLMKDSKISLY